MSRADLTIHGSMTVRAVLRRRVAVGVLVALPLAFYLASRNGMGQSVRALLFGVSWAMSTVTFFSVLASRQIEPRLSLAGPSRASLATARTTAMTAMALLLSGGFLAVVAVDQDLPDLAAVGVAFATTAVVAVALGSAIGSLIGKEMEGALVLFLFAGLQAVANPFDAWTTVLPFWSSRELGTYAIDGANHASLASGLLHAVAVIGTCVLICAGRTAARRSMSRSPSWH